MKKKILVLVVTTIVGMILFFMGTANALSFFAINNQVDQDIVQNAIIELETSAVADLVAVAVNIAPVIQTALNVAPTIQTNIQVSDLVNNLSPVIELPDIILTLPENFDIKLNFEIPDLGD